MNDAKKQLAAIVTKTRTFVDSQRKRLPGARVLSSTPMASSATAREAALILALEKSPAQVPDRELSPRSVKVLFVSDAPISPDGPAGRLLAKIIKAMGLASGDATVCLTPSLAEISARLRPRVLVALGEAAARSASGSDLEFSKIRGRFHEHLGLPLMPTHHPSELLSNEALKRHVWDDIKLVAAKLKP